MEESYKINVFAIIRMCHLTQKDLFKRNFLMINFQNNQPLKFKNIEELYSFMDKQTSEDFDIYSNLYTKENPNWKLIKENGKSKVVKNILTVNELHIKNINANFCNYECSLKNFDGILKVNIDKNDSFISNINNSNINLEMWDKMVDISA